MTVLKSKTRKFDKKNALAFAEELYSEKDGEVRFLKLCSGELSNGKAGKRTMHCAVGEAYFKFVSQDMRQVLSYDLKEKEYDSELCPQSDGSTAAAIDALVAKAALKLPTKANKRKLTDAIYDCVETNDGVDSFSERSEDVAGIWIKRVAPLLK